MFLYFHILFHILFLKLECYYIGRAMYYNGVALPMYDIMYVWVEIKFLNERNMETIM